MRSPLRRAAHPESPANVYNPLFLYGSSGLGKTHLMHAIGHYILKNYDNKKVLYVSSEMFTNELINALRNKEVGPFKHKYRDIDVLLIDDIQFIEGKESTQEKFFHTLKALMVRPLIVDFEFKRKIGYAF